MNEKAYILHLGNLLLKYAKSIKSLNMEKRVKKIMNSYNKLGLEKTLNSFDNLINVYKVQL